MAMTVVHSAAGDPQGPTDLAHEYRRMTQRPPAGSASVRRARSRLSEDGVNAAERLMGSLLRFHSARWEFVPFADNVVVEREDGPVLACAHGIASDGKPAGLHYRRAVDADRPEPDGPGVDKIVRGVMLPPASVLDQHYQSRPCIVNRPTLAIEGRPVVVGIGQNSAEQGIRTLTAMTVGVGPSGSRPSLRPARRGGRATGTVP